ncbi:hypothetical protein [Jannaschia pohangensis]|uniref:Uncharacterized protein n=1 Tax=Jannaschia pohangensis TaxID=390807 RepID=A0A1I3PXB1_9RHOB|nr:hypothetical protein [Jannaschia pohangensis]SFJ26298.1 hypothetical protein SAMN04488095_2340 [Jannaschia pohangensis]
MKIVITANDAAFVRGAVLDVWAIDALQHNDRGRWGYTGDNGIETLEVCTNECRLIDRSLENMVFLHEAGNLTETCIVHVVLADDRNLLEAFIDKSHAAYTEFHRRRKELEAAQERRA